MSRWEQPRFAPVTPACPKTGDQIPSRPAHAERDETLTSHFGSDWLTGPVTNVYAGVWGEFRRPYWWFTHRDDGVAMVALQQPVPHVICHPRASPTGPAPTVSEATLHGVSRQDPGATRRERTGGRRWTVPNTDAPQARIVVRDVRMRAAEVLSLHEESLTHWEMVGWYLARRARRSVPPAKLGALVRDAIRREVAPACLLADALTGPWDANRGRYDTWPVLPHPVD